MQLVIDYFFDVLLDLWTLIKSSWLMSIAVILVVINFIITLINGSQGND